VARRRRQPCQNLRSYALPIVDGTAAAVKAGLPDGTAVSIDNAEDSEIAQLADLGGLSAVNRSGFTTRCRQWCRQRLGSATSERKNRQGPQLIAQSHKSPPGMTLWEGRPPHTQHRLWPARWPQ